MERGERRKERMTKKGREMRKIRWGGGLLDNE